MNKEFFNLPTSTKRLIWEALLARWLLARWAAKKPITR